MGKTNRAAAAPLIPRLPGGRSQARGRWWHFAFGVLLARGSQAACLLLVLAGGTATAQQPGRPLSIARYIPGNYLSDNLHRVELRNNTARTLDVGGYLIVTRNYSTILPAGTRIAPGAVLALGKTRRPDYPVNLELNRSPDFLIRLYPRTIEGNYCAVFDRQMNLLDAFYHAQLRSVPFLPITDTLITASGRRLAYTLPPETQRVWGYFQVGDDPAIGFEQTDKGWRITSSNPGITLYPPLAFDRFTARYAQGVVTLRWNTRFEENLAQLVLERSADQIRFVPTDTIEPSGGPALPADYIVYNALPGNGATWYYRLRATGTNGTTVYSKVVEAVAKDIATEFWLDITPGPAARAGEVNIRFYSAYSQRIKIKLLDDQRREVAILFSSQVYPDSQHLLRLSDRLPPGTYLLAAATDSRRYFRQLTILP